MNYDDRDTAYFLRQMDDRVKKHFISIGNNHPVEMPFSQDEKLLMIRLLIRRGLLTDNIDIGASGIPNYKNVFLTEKGKHFINMEDL